MPSNEPTKKLWSNRRRRRKCGKKLFEKKKTVKKISNLIKQVNL